MYDVIIVGGGPAGLTAFIYTSRARLKTLLIESYTPPSQIIFSDLIENYPGFPDGINGFELIEKFKNQAKKFGTEFVNDTVKSIKEIDFENKKIWQIITEKNTYNTFSVIIASGSKPKKIGVPGEDRFQGKGVSYCGVCDGAFFKDKDVVVIGGGDTAIQETLFLTKFAKKIYLVHRRDRLRATKILQERIFENKKIEFVWKSTIEEILGKEKVEKVIIKNLVTQQKSEISCHGVFIFIGSIPNTDFVKGVVELNKDGYVITDIKMRTSKEGVFACGDCRETLLRQVITACGDGAIAAFSAQEYVEDLKGIGYK